MGQHFGLGAADINQVILASKWKGVSLFDEDRIDIPVNVVRRLAPSLTNRNLEPYRVQVMLWGFVRRVK